MGWRIVKQPNGLLARFSDVVDHFTHLDFREDEAVELCMGYGCSMHEAQAKVDAGVRDFKPWTTTPGNGLERWDHCLEAVGRVHGQDEVSSLLRGLTPQEKGV
jgi:hypothetical protein